MPVESVPATTLPSLPAERPAVAGAAAGAWSGLSNRRIVALHTLSLALPLTAGLTMYGWRAAASVGTVVLCAIIAALFWRRVGRRGSELHLAGIFHLSLLLAMTLPAHLFAFRIPLEQDVSAMVWPILPAAGLTLVALCWLLGGSRRVHPVLLTNLLMVVLFESTQPGRWVLEPTSIFLGDLLNVVDPIEAQPDTQKTEWRDLADIPHAQAIRRQSAASRLTLFTTGVDRPQRNWLSLESVIRDDLPPMENLFLAGEPGSIGTTSALAVVIGGLVLLYCGLIDYRIPLLMVVSAFVALLVLPVPVVVTEVGPQWQWFAFRPGAARWDVAITFANYEILSSPLLFAAMFLAPSPSLRPIHRAWRPVYAIIAGVLAAAVQLYVGVASGPYVALLLAGLLVPAMDQLFRSRAE